MVDIWGEAEKSYTQNVGGNKTPALNPFDEAEKKAINPFDQAETDMSVNFGRTIVEGSKDVARNLITFLKAADEESWRATLPNNPELAKQKHAESVKKDVLMQQLDEKWLQADGSLKRPEGFKGYVQDVVRMIPQIGSQIAATAVSGPVGGTAIMATQIAGSDLQDESTKDVDPERRFKAALGDAFAQAPFEQLGLSKALSFWKPGKIASSAIKGIVESSTVEYLTELVQKYPELAAKIWASGEGKTMPEMFDEFAEGFWEATKEGVYEGLVAAPFGAVTGGLGGLKTGTSSRDKLIPKTSGVVKGQVVDLSQEAAPDTVTATETDKDAELESKAKQAEASGNIELATRLKNQITINNDTSPATTPSRLDRLAQIDEIFDTISKRPEAVNISEEQIKKLKSERDKIERADFNYTQQTPYLQEIDELTQSIENLNNQIARPDESFTEYEPSKEELIQRRNAANAQLTRITQGKTDQERIWNATREEALRKFPELRKQVEDEITVQRLTPEERQRIIQSHFPALYTDDAKRPVRVVEEIDQKQMALEIMMLKGMLKTDVKPAAKSAMMDRLEVLKRIDENQRVSGLQDELRSFGKGIEKQAIKVERDINKTVGKAALDVYHGSPHKFDKFSMDKVGTGEGAQAFGYGLYFTDRKDIAAHYAKTLASSSKKSASDLMAETIEMLSDKDASGLLMANGINPSENARSEAISKFKNKELDSAKTFLYLDGKKLFPDDAHIYKATLFPNRTDEVWLDWDKPIPKRIADKLNEKIDPYKLSDGEIERILIEQYGWEPHDIESAKTDRFIHPGPGEASYRDMLDYVVNITEITPKVTGEMLYNTLSSRFNSKKKASLFLKRAGIDGIRYPAGSLSGGGEGTNYVVFDDSAIEIKGVNEKWSVSPQAEITQTQIEGIKQVFPGSPVSPITVEFKDATLSGYSVTLPNNKQIFIFPNRTAIPYNLSKIASDHGLSPSKLSSMIQSGKVKVGGSYSNIGNEGMIELAFGSDLGTLSHEKFHALFDLALTEDEKARILKRYGTEEKAAEAFRKREGFTRTFWEKIQAFIDKLKSLILGDVFKPAIEMPMEKQLKRQAVDNISGIQFEPDDMDMIFASVEANNIKGDTIQPEEYEPAWLSSHHKAALARMNPELKIAAQREAAKVNAVVIGETEGYGPIPSRIALHDNETKSNVNVLTVDGIQAAIVNHREEFYKAKKHATLPVLNNPDGMASLTFKNVAGSSKDKIRRAYDSIYTRKGDSVKSSDIDTSDIDRKRMGMSERMFRPPQWIAKRWEWFRKIFDVEDTRQSDRSKALTEALTEAKSFFNLSKEETEHAGTVIFEIEGKQVIKSEHIYFDENQNIHQNENHYSELRKYFDSKFNVSDKVKDAVIFVRKSLDKDLIAVWNFLKSHKDIDAATIDTFRNSIGKIYNYFPHIRYGNYFVELKDKEGNTVYRKHFDAPNKRVADTHAAYIMNNDSYLKPILESGVVVKPEAGYHANFVEKLPEDAFSIPIPIEALQAVMDSAISKVKSNTEVGGDEMSKLVSAFENLLPRSIAEVMQSRGWGSHLIKRKNIEGFERNNIKRVLFDYKTGLYGWLTKMDASRKFADVMYEAKDLSKKDPNQWEAMRQYTYDMLRNQDNVDKIANNLRAIFFAKYLGFNIKTSILNLTQNMITGWPRLSMEVSGSFGKYINGAASTLVDMYKQVRGSESNLNEYQKRLVFELHEEGYTQAQFINNIRGQLGGDFKSISNKTMQVLAWPMAIAEKFNRTSLALAAFNAIADGKVDNTATLERYGLAPGEALDLSNEEHFEKAKEFAREITIDSHFIYGKSNRPEVMRGSKALRMASTAYTFRTFTHHLLNIWRHMLVSDRGKTALFRSMGATLALGGIASLPLYKTFMHVLRQVTGDDWDEEVKDIAVKLTTATANKLGIDPHEDMMRNIVSYGLPVLVGVNLGGSLGMEVPILERSDFNKSLSDQLSQGFGDLIGVPFAAVKDVNDAFTLAVGGKFGRASEKILPSAFASGLKALRIRKEGMRTVSGAPINFPDNSGKAPVPFKTTAGQASAQVFGFTPVENAQMWDMTQKIKDLQIYRNSKQGAFVDRIIRAIIDGGKDSKAEINRVALEIMEYNRKQIEKGNVYAAITDESFAATFRAKIQGQKVPVYMLPLAIELRKKYTGK